MTLGFDTDTYCFICIKVSTVLSYFPFSTCNVFNLSSCPLIKNGFAMVDEA